MFHFITNELEQSTLLPHENIKEKWHHMNWYNRKDMKFEHYRNDGQENHQHSRKVELCYLSNEWQDQLHTSDSTNLNYEIKVSTSEQIFSRHNFRRFMIWNWWQSPIFLFIPQHTVSCNEKVTIMNWQCHLKQRTRKANILYVLPLASTWGRTVNFNVLYIILR
jgi:hypothetical protein